MELQLLVDWLFGIDTQAHIAAMNETGKTIAVLGSGFANIFPEENSELFHNIIQNGGLILTEYEPEEKPKLGNFPKRNRILSGLSSGTVVIESGYRSGANLTANIAISQGRKAFCLPCNVDSPYYGTNDLLLKGEVKLAVNIEQIIEECGIVLTNAYVDSVKRRIAEIDGLYGK
ncbi:MAG: DNA-protecting protein DprA [Oscillospiraceae bacterium]|nr:DNA-protecting protein DprA [Oscillospiraceae bacterium]